MGGRERLKIESFILRGLVSIVGEGGGGRERETERERDRERENSTRKRYFTRERERDWGGGRWRHTVSSGSPCCTHLTKVPTLSALLPATCELPDR